MYNTIMECMAGGGAYSAYIRLDLSSGDVVTKEAEIVSKYWEKGKLTVTKRVTVSKKELTGDITRISFTDGTGGAPLVGGEATISGSDSGELSTVATLTLTLNAPSGYRGSDKFFDVLTGTTPYEDKFTARYDSGGSVVIIPAISSNGITLTFAFDSVPAPLYVYYDNELAFIWNLTDKKDETSTVTVSSNGELFGTGVNQTLMELTDASSNAKYEGSLFVRFPLLLSNVENKFLRPEKGEMQAHGDYISFVDNDVFRLYGKDMSPVSERKIAGIKSYAFTQSGYCAIANESEIIVFKGGKDIAAISKSAVISVAISDGKSGLRVYCTDGKSVQCYAITASSGVHQVYSKTISCLGIVTNNEKLIVITSTGSSVISVSGTVGTGVTTMSNIDSITARAEGTALVRMKNGINCLVRLNYATNITNGVLSVCDNMYLLNIYGTYRLMIIGSEVKEIAVLDADSMAFAHNRLYYKRGDDLYYRDALTYNTEVYDDNLVAGGKVKVRETGETPFRSGQHGAKATIKTEV